MTLDGQTQGRVPKGSHGDLGEHAPAGQLRWRCRRGMKELDLLLTRYVDEEYSSASAAQRLAFRELLDCQDPVIHAYFLGRQTPPTVALAALVERITAAGPNTR